MNHRERVSDTSHGHIFNWIDQCQSRSREFLLSGPYKKPALHCFGAIFLMRLVLMRLAIRGGRTEMAAPGLRDRTACGGRDFQAAEAGRPDRRPAGMSVPSRVICRSRWIGGPRRMAVAGVLRRAQDRLLWLSRASRSSLLSGAGAGAALLRRTNPAAAAPPRSMTRMGASQRTAVSARQAGRRRTVSP